MSSRRRSNGASPLINPQRQITSFFAKATSSPSPSPIPKSNSSPSPSPSPLESKPSPTKCYGEEVVGKRIKVLWPADRAWYKGCVKSFNKDKARHLIQYDDGDEEELDLSREEFEWLQDTVTNLKRLRRGPLPTTPEEEKEESHEDDDSGDEDWGKSAEKEVVEEEEDETMELEDEEDSDEGVPKSKGKRGGGSGKRKLSGGGNLGSAKKTKSGGDVVTNGLKANLTEPTTKAESKTLPSKL